MSRALDTYTDTELARLLHDAEHVTRDVFSELYDRHEQRIYAYALRVTGSRDDASDILQDTFIKFYNALQHTIVENVGAYLVMTARNLCLNHKRSKRFYEPLSEELVGESLAQKFEQTELMGLIGKALQALELEQREAFVLRFYHGMEYEEMADVAGESVNAMRNRVWRAKEKLKQILAPFIHELNGL